jgi:hypothetical protein
MVAFDAAAADYPTTGMLYNHQEDSSLTYNCTLQAGQQRLRCEFIQTAARSQPIWKRSSMKPARTIWVL